MSEVKQPEALRLADALDENADMDSSEGGNPDVCSLEWSAAKELRRLHEQNAELLEALQAMLTQFGGDTNGIGAKERCAAICLAQDAVDKATGETE